MFGIRLWHTTHLIVSAESDYHEQVTFANVHDVVLDAPREEENIAAFDGEFGRVVVNTNL